MKEEIESLVDLRQVLLEKVKNLEQQKMELIEEGDMRLKEQIEQFEKEHEDSLLD